MLSDLVCSTPISNNDNDLSLLEIVFFFAISALSFWAFGLSILAYGHIYKGKQNARTTDYPRIEALRIARKS